MAIVTKQDLLSFEEEIAADFAAKKIAAPVHLAGGNENDVTQTIRDSSDKYIFYVYEHWRPDTDTCFYVGKGHGRRAYRTDTGQRNHNYIKVAKKLAAIGMCIEVRLVASGLLEDEAFSLERDRIAFWRMARVKLVNLTDGGEGTSGFVYTEELRMRRSIDIKAANARPEVRERRRISATLAHANPDTKQKHKIGCKRGQNTPDAKKRKSVRMIALRAHPEKEAKRRAALLATFARPDVAIKKSLAMLAVRNRPGMSQKITAAIRAAMKRPEVKAKLGMATKDSRWITNGRENKRLKKGTPLPTGWIFGKRLVCTS